MNNNKVIIALSALSIYELNRLQKFVNSPYFNKNEKLISHFDYIFHSIKLDQQAPVNKLEVWRHTFGKKSFNDTKFRKLNTDLLRLIEEFFAIEGFQKNPLHKANYLLKAIAEKKIEKLYNSTLNTVDRLSRYQLEKGSSYFYYQYQIEKNIFNLTTQYEKKSKSKSDQIDLNITRIVNNLDIFFLTEKMKYYNSLYSWKNISKNDEQIRFIDDLIENIQKIDFKAFPILHGHYLVYLTTSQPDHKLHFENLKKVIRENVNVFPLSEMKIIFDSACNYCVRKVNIENEFYYRELFKLYEFGMSNEIFLEAGELDPALFRNIVIIALRLNNFEWVEKFISDYSGFLNEKYRQNAISFNLARLYWYEKKFDEVLKQLRDVEYDDIFYNLNSKVILLSTYYELDEYDALDFLIKSFKVFLRRKNNLPDRMKSNYLNFTKYLERLTKVSMGDKQKIDLFKKNLEKESLVSSKFWLLEKAEELAG